MLLGRRGERAAARFLKRHCRHRILTSNFRCPAGEIDLITQDGDTIAFVEVKTRSSGELSKPFEAVGRNKRRRIENAARYYLLQNHAQEYACRFDVVSIIWPKKGSPTIEHFENAFGPQPRT